MQFKPFSALLAFAVGTASANNGPSHGTLCLTDMATTSIKHIPTAFSTFTSTYTFSITHTVQQTVTITPTPSTQTGTTTVVTTLTTSLVAVTDVAQVVSTNYATTTITGPDVTITSSSTYYVTSTVVPSTTAPTPNNFKPVQETLPNSSEEETQLGLPSKRHAIAKSNIRYCNQKKYAQNVNCLVEASIFKTITVTKTKPATTTTAKAFTTTIMETATITGTDFIIPADVTVSTTSATLVVIEVTTTPSVTITVTPTSTSTVMAPTQTIYAMCLGQNYADSRSGLGSIQGYTPPNYVVEQQMGSITNPFDCCQQCASTTNCVATIFYGNQCSLEMNLGNRACTELTPCTASVLLNNQDNTPDSIVSNGIAFQWTSWVDF